MDKLTGQYQATFNQEIIDYLHALKSQGKDQDSEIEKLILTSEGFKKWNEELQHKRLMEELEKLKEVKLPPITKEIRVHYKHINDFGKCRNIWHEDYLYRANGKLYLWDYSTASSIELTDYTKLLCPKCKKTGHAFEEESL